MIRYGILGFGHHAVKRLLPAFKHTKQSQLAGFWRRDQQKAAANAVEHHLRSFATAEDLCASPEIDAIFITSPDSLHLPDVLLAAKHSKAVLCEKPLAMNAGEVEQMLAAAEKAGVVFGVAQNMRYHHSLDVIREWIEAGRIGAPLTAHAEFCYSAERSPREWIYDPALACGGPIGDVGIHCMDALRYALQSDVTETVTIAHRDAQSGEVESHAVMSLAFSSGAVGAVTLTTRGRYRSAVEITGELGVIACENALTVDHPVDVLLLKGWDGVEEKKTVSNEDAYTRMLDAFSRAITGDGAFLSPAKDGLHNQRVLDASYESWRRGRLVLIPK